MANQVAVTDARPYDAPVEERERLFGRDAEWNAIEKLLAAGQGGLVLVIGGPGSGKTSLLLTLHQALARWIHDPGHLHALSHYTSLPDLDQASPGPSPPGADELAAYETGLSDLLNRLGRDTPDYEDGLRFQQRLIENITEVRQYGSTESLRADRARIITGLNELARAALGMTFNELCKLTAPAAPQENKRLAAGFCEDLVKGLRSRAKELLEVCQIEPDELVYRPGQDLRKYLGIFHTIYEACVRKTNLAKLVLLIDDADRLLQTPWGTEFLTALRIMFSPELDLRKRLAVFMAGGSRLHQVTDQAEILGICASHWSNPIFLNNLPAEAVQNIIKEFNPAAGVNADLAASIYRQTGGHPYLAKHLVKALETLEPEAIGQTASVLVGRDKMLQALFGDWCESCGDEGQQVYRLLCDSPRGLSRSEIRQRVKPADPSRLYSVLDLLCCYGVTTRAVVDGQDLYQVAGEMFAHWFRDYA